jgi:hypothetical protein
MGAYNNVAMPSAQDARIAWTIWARLCCSAFQLSAACPVRRCRPAAYFEEDDCGCPEASAIAPDAGSVASDGFIRTQILRHLEMMPQGRQRLVCPFLQFRIVAALGITLE